MKQHSIDVSFEEVLNVISGFLGEVFECILNEKEAFGLWNPKKMQYE